MDSATPAIKHMSAAYTAKERAKLRRRSEAENIRRIERERFGDIVSVLMSGDTQREEVLQCLRYGAHVIICEMANLRQQESNAEIELNLALQDLERVEREYDLVHGAIKSESSHEAHSWGLPQDYAEIFASFDTGAASPGVAVSLGAYSDLNPPSGRAPPLLRTSAESIHVPVRPSSVNRDGSLRHFTGAEKREPGGAEQKRLQNCASSSSSSYSVTPENSTGGMNSEIEDKQGHSQRVAYVEILRRVKGSLLHRAHAMRAIQAAFDPELSKRLPRKDAQLAFFYCMYTSAEFRSFVCKHKHPARPRELHRLHPTKQNLFMCGLNKLSEEYDLGRMNEQTYLASLRHLHVNNFVPILRDGEVEMCLTRAESTPSMQYYGRREPWPDVKKSSNELLKRSYELRRSSPLLVKFCDDDEVRAIAAKDSERQHSVSSGGGGGEGEPDYSVLDDDDILNDLDSLDMEVDEGSGAE